MKREMQGKVIPIRTPGQERKRLTVFAGAFAVILLIVALLAMEGGRNWDALHRFFAYGGDELHFELDTGADVAADLDGTLVTVGSEGVAGYTGQGTIRFITTAKMENPVLLTGEDRILAYDAGGEDILLLQGGGSTLLQTKTDGAIFDCDMASDGSLCSVSCGGRVKSVLQVYDREQLPCFTVNSASRYFTVCAVSEGADLVCAVALGQENGVFISTAVIYRTDREEPIAELSLGNQVIYDMVFWGKDRICALGESSAVVFTAEGKEIGTVACEGVKAFNLHGGSFGVLQVPAETGYDLIAVNRSARIVGRRSLGDAAVQLDVSGKYVAWLSGSGLTICGQKLEPWFETNVTGAGTQVCVTKEGTAYLVGAKAAERYLP